MSPKQKTVLELSVMAFESYSDGVIPAAHQIVDRLTARQCATLKMNPLPKGSLEMNVKNGQTELNFQIDSAEEIHWFLSNKDNFLEGCMQIDSDNDMDMVMRKFAGGKW